MGLRELGYSMTGTTLGTRALSVLGSRVTASRLANAAKPALMLGPSPERSVGPPRHPMLVVLTIDTEGGFVADDERRVWQGGAPHAHQGFHRGVANLNEVLARHGAPGTFLVSPHFLSAGHDERERSRAALLEAAAAGAEIGLHLHPESDRALSALVGDVARASHDTLVAAGKRLLEEALALRVTSFRWGNWALDAARARAVAASGFTIDSSAVPGLYDRKRRHAPRFDWQDCPRALPWRMALDHPFTEDARSPLLEMPIATFELFGRALRADPLFGPLLGGAFDHFRAHAPRSERPFAFVVMTHSTEATRRDGRPTRTLRDLETFVASLSKMDDVEVVTLNEAAKRVSPL